MNEPDYHEDLSDIMIILLKIEEPIIARWLIGGNYASMHQCLGSIASTRC